jgi:cob(I)alamin adenosyltransferase
MERIYKRTGDDGQTGLLGGGRLSKAHDRFEALGTVDELNAAIGRLRSELPAGSAAERSELLTVQRRLHIAGSHLAAPAGAEVLPRLAALTPDCWTTLEQAIDRMERQLPTLEGFIVPGGHISAAQAHVCRTVCRRAERAVVRLIATGMDMEETHARPIAVFLNRLADYLFVLARTCNRATGTGEELARPTNAAPASSAR